MVLNEQPILQSLKQYINQFPPTTKFSIALSGGIDSICLAHALSLIAPNRMEAIHVNHGLGMINDQMTIFCQKFSDKSNIDLKAYYIKNTFQNGNLEGQMRKYRYALLAKHASGLLMTAHHAQDKLESQLMYTAQGRIAALPECCAQQRTLRDGFTIHRPFIHIKKSDIIKYAQDHKLTWFEDPSNQNTVFLRNSIRHHIIPRLKDEQLLALIPRYCDLMTRLRRQVELRLFRKWINHNRFSYQRASLDALVFQTFFGQKTGYWLGLDHVDYLLNQMQRAAHDKNPAIRAGSYDIRRYQNQLYIMPINIESSPWQLTLYPTNITVSRRSNMPEPNPMSKKIKKLFQKYNIPTWLRNELPIFHDKNELIAIWQIWIKPNTTDFIAKWSNPPEIVKNHALPLSNSPFFQYNATKISE